MTLSRAFFDRPVVEVARDMVGWTVRHGATAGRIVETEAYHESEPACHAFGGHTPRLDALFAAPGTAYVYRSYGIHALLNAVCEADGVGAAVLIRALEPVAGATVMARRRGRDDPGELCSGPGKLTQALAVGLDRNGTSLLGTGPVLLEPPAAGAAPRLVVGTRIGITRAVDLPWRFCDASSRHVSRPGPPAMRRVSRTAR